MPVQNARPAVTLTPGQPAARKKADGPLWEACANFEGMFLKQLLATMRQGKLGEGMLKEGVTQQTMMEMHDSALAESLGRAGRLGLATLIHSQLTKAVQSATAAAEAAAAKDTEGGQVA